MSIYSVGSLYAMSRFCVGKLTFLFITTTAFLICIFDSMPKLWSSKLGYVQVYPIMSGFFVVFAGGREYMFKLIIFCRTSFCGTKVRNTFTSSILALSAVFSRVKF